MCLELFIANERLFYSLRYQVRNQEQRREKIMQNFEIGDSFDYITKSLKQTKNILIAD